MKIILSKLVCQMFEMVSLISALRLLEECWTSRTSIQSKTNKQKAKKTNNDTVHDKHRLYRCFAIKFYCKGKGIVLAIHFLLYSNQLICQSNSFMCEDLTDQTIDLYLF